jgi:hypothetical protein
MTNFGLRKVSTKTDTQHSNDHISSSFDDHYPAETNFSIQIMLHHRCRWRFFSAKYFEKLPLKLKPQNLESSWL